MDNRFTAVGANGGVIVNAYKDETREWWNQVNEEAIYDIIGQKEFELYIKLFVTGEPENSEPYIISKVA